MTVTAASVASIAARCLRAPGAVDPDTPLALLGLDSLSTIEMAAELEAAFGCELPADVLIDCANARLLAARISALRRRPAGDGYSDPFDLMRSDAVLPDEVRPMGGTGVGTALRGARRILLTGATGFLGGRLLAELLAATEAEIVCLVRDPSCLAHPAARVHAITGDLSRRRLGLGQVQFEDLADTTDAVLHCGAVVNWVFSYSGLRAANVSGTLELLRLACRRGVPFHFISSLSVCYSAGGPRAVDEGFDPLPHLRGVHLGYAQTKVVAEALVSEAGRRGLPVRIYRPALISGDSENGAFNRDDLISALVRGCVRMGTAPDLDWTLDCQPVDVVARAVVRLSAGGDRVLHLGHARPRHWRECVLWMRMYGYDVRLVPYHAWLRQLDAETAASVPSAAAHPLRPLRTFFLNRHGGTGGLTLPELYEESRRTSASSAQTLAALATTGMETPLLDAELLDTYFAAFRAAGDLPAPTLNTVDLPPAAAAQHCSAMPAPAASWTASDLALLLNRPVAAVTILDSGSGHSIVSELTAWRSGRRTGLFKAQVTYPDGAENIVRLKAKASDTAVTAVGEALAGVIDPAVRTAYARWSTRVGFAASHLREIAIYRQTDPRFVRHTPALLGSSIDQGNGTWLLALEDVGGAELMNAADTPELWRARDIEAALHGLAALQSIWFNRERELRAMPWIGYVRGAAGMAEMADFWSSLAAQAAPAFSSWTTPGIAGVQHRLIATIPQWSSGLDAVPRTLIHHDFNPRNVCLRTGVLCAYDWELATVGAPQRDLVEFLCFVLHPASTAGEVQHWIDHFRVALERETCTSIDADAWQRGVRAALYELMLDRLPTYALVHRVRRQSFLPRIVRTWWHLYEQFPLEDEA